MKLSPLSWDPLRAALRETSQIRGRKRSSLRTGLRIRAPRQGSTQRSGRTAWLVVVGRAPASAGAADTTQQLHRRDSHVVIAAAAISMHNREEIEAKTGLRLYCTTSPLFEAADIKSSRHLHRLQLTLDERPTDRPVPELPARKRVFDFLTIAQNLPGYLLPPRTLGRTNHEQLRPSPAPRRHMN